VSYFKKIVKKWSQKIGKLGPNSKNKHHIFHLENVLLEEGWTWDAINKFVLLLEAPTSKKRKPGEVWQSHKKGDKEGKPTGDWNAMNPEGNTDSFGDNKEKADKYANPSGKGDKEEPSGKLGAGDFERETEPERGAVPKKKKKKKPAPNKPISEAEIDDIDGDSKLAVMNGEEQPPGTKSSAVSEIGTGYAMAFLDTHPNDVDGCLKDKLDTTELGSSSKNNNETKRKQMIRSARREKQRVNETLEREGMSAENTKVSHIGGSQGSLDDAVTRLEELEKAGITHIPGPPPNGVKIADTLDKDGNVIEYGYKSIIKHGGGGEDPTDTIVFMIEYDDKGKPIKAAINHTSNKMTTEDQQSNSGPKKTANNNNERAKESLPPEEHDKADKIAKDTTDEIAKQRKEQAEYVGGYTQRLSDFADDDATLDLIYKRLMNDKTGTPPGISGTPEKYLKIALKRVGLSPEERKALMVPPPNEAELKKHLKTYLQSLKDKTPGLSLRDDKEKGMAAEDISIISRLLVDEKMITGEEPKSPAMTDADLRSYYVKQTDALNKQREELNKLGAGQKPPIPDLGDKTFIQDLMNRMHLNIAEGHRAGASDGPPKHPGIPNGNFDLIHGEYKNLVALGLKQDAKGNMYANEKDGWYLLDKNGEPTGNPIKKGDPRLEKLEEFDCAVVGDPAVHRDCLGLKEGQSIEDGMTVTYEPYKMEDGSDQIKAIIYDHKNRVIATQTCRSKSGPGGMVQDSMKWGQEYQKCMAIATKKLGLCG